MVRFKYRYFVVRIVFVDNRFSKGEPFYIKQDILLESVRNKIKELHGDFGVAAVDFGLQVKYSNPRTQVMVFRAQHGAHRFLATSLPFVKVVNSIPVTLRTLYIGATIRKCFSFLQRYQKDQLKKMWPLLSEEEKKEVEEAFLDIRFYGQKKDARNRKEDTPSNDLV